MKTRIPIRPICSRFFLSLLLLAITWGISAQTKPAKSPPPALDTLPSVAAQQDTSAMPIPADTIGQAERQRKRQAEVDRQTKAIRELFGDGVYGRSEQGSSPRPYSLTGTLTDRRVVERPAMAMKPGSHKNGRVVLDICVDSSGKVITAEYQLKGSTTTDPELREQSLTWAWQFRFSHAEEEKACGVITFDFREK